MYVFVFILYVFVFCLRERERERERERGREIVSLGTVGLRIFAALRTLNNINN